MASTRPLSVSQIISGWAVAIAWDATAAMPPGAYTGQALMLMSSIIQPSKPIKSSNPSKPRRPRGPSRRCRLAHPKSLNLYTEVSRNGG